MTTRRRLEMFTLLTSVGFSLSHGFGFAQTTTNTTALNNQNVSDSDGLVIDQDTDGTYSGDISGGGGLTKKGTGAVTLSGHDDYNGSTDIEGGLRQPEPWRISRDGRGRGAADARERYGRDMPLAA